MNHVVVLKFPNGKVRVIGNADGAPLSKAGAEDLARRYLTSTFNIINAFAIPIEPLSSHTEPTMKERK